MMVAVNLSADAVHQQTNVTVSIMLVGLRAALQLPSYRPSQLEVETWQGCINVMLGPKDD